MDQVVAIGQCGELILHHIPGSDIRRIALAQVFYMGFEFFRTAGEHKAFDDIRIVHIKCVGGADSCRLDAAEKPFGKNIPVIDHRCQGYDRAESKGKTAQDTTDFGKKG